MTTPTPHALQPPPSAARLPVLFVGHGSPENALEKNVWHLNWRDMGQQLRQRHGAIAAILCISAHWLTPGNTWLTGMAQPATLHDFQGFSQALFAVQYRAPGAPALAAQLAQQLRHPVTGKALQVDADQWGLDHGAWSVLLAMFPEADIPVLQLSLDSRLSAAGHAALGQQLGVLREQGVLILASGNIVHNLLQMRRGAGLNAAFDWAQAFDQRTAQCLIEGDMQSLVNFAHWGPVAAQAHPSAEHFWPLLYAGAAAGPQERPQFFNTGFQAASISMRSVLWDG